MIIRSLWTPSTVLQLSGVEIILGGIALIIFLFAAFLILIIVLAVFDGSEQEPKLKDSDTLQDLEYTALANQDFLQELSLALLEKFKKEHVYWEKESETELVCRQQHTDAVIGKIQIDSDGVITAQSRNGENLLRDIHQVDTNEPDMELSQAAATIYENFKASWRYITE